MPEGIGFSLFVLAVIVFLGGFALGTQWNIRKGDTALKWFRQGLSIIGEKTTMRWHGSSVLELKMEKPKEPFRSAETLVVFEPRDVPLLWLFFHSRGRRDLLIFRAQLRSAPSFEIEAYDPQAWMAARIVRDVAAKNWSQLDLRSASLQGYASNNTEAAAVRPLVALAQRGGGKLVRLSVHRSVPNLEVHWQLPDARSSPSQDWFMNLRLLAEETLKI
jgi:hypothetical protein